MTRRIAVIRAIAAPPDMATAAIGAFPGAIVVASGAGLVTHAWGADAPGAPLGAGAIAGAVGRGLHEVLGLGDDDAVAGQLQLWLACAIGVDAEMFRLSLGDPPRHLPAGGGRGPVELDFGPIFDVTGMTSAVSVFVRPGAAVSGQPAAAAAAALPEQIEQFFVESQAPLEDCHAQLAKLAHDREARHCVHRMFRAIHTVKGAARACGLGPIADLAHELEERLAVLRDPEHRVRGAELEVVRDLLGQLGQRMLVDAPEGAMVDAMASLYGAYRPLMARADEAFNAWQSRPRDGELAHAFLRTLRHVAAVVAPFRMRALAARVATVIELVTAAGATQRPPRRLYAEIDQQLERLRELTELYQEVYREVRAHASPTRVVREVAAQHKDATALARTAASEGLVALGRAIARSDDPARLAALTEDLPRMFAPAPASIGARAALAAAQLSLFAAAAALVGPEPADRAAVAAQIRDTAHRLTWSALDEVVRRARRQATALAGQLGKRVEVDVDAFSAVVPEAVHRTIGEMLLHAVRNAVDHGIEPVDERARVGKRATGRISIRVATSAAAVQLEVVDDGRGVDVERVRARAVASGLVSATTAALLSPAELHELVFHPGLSTADQVSAVSGRGVGMDVIRTLAGEHGGTAELSSDRGQWTRLLVSVPLST